MQAVHATIDAAGQEHCLYSKEVQVQRQGLKVGQSWQA